MRLGFMLINRERFQMNNKDTKHGNKSTVAMKDKLKKASADRASIFGSSGNPHRETSPKDRDNLAHDLAVKEAILRTG